MPARNITLNHIPSSPVTKQGIVAILGSDCERNKSAASIRRTLSADMSSKKWLEQDGFFSPFKKTVSSSDSSSSSSEVEEEFYQTSGVDDVWSAIQASKQVQKPTKMEPWGSIFSQKSEKSILPPPYVHPLVKRSVSGLSETSLEICTECLGSETGSDSYPSICSIECLSDGDQVCKENRREVREYTDPLAGLRVAKYKSSPARPLPPPLPSIAAAGDGSPHLHMKSRRENGRLILDAVSVSAKNYFHAQRRDGRLILTLVCGGKTAEENKEDEEVFDNMEKLGEEVPAEEVVDDGGGDSRCLKADELVVEKNLSWSSGTIGVHKKGLEMKKFVAVKKMNATWTNKGEKILAPQSLPPLSLPMARLIPAAATSFNAYDYFWRNKTTFSSGGFINSITGSDKIKNKNPNNDNNNSNSQVYENGNGDLVIVKGNKGEQLVSYLRGCKEPRRSLLIGEPYCIATS